jgi:hypothetical protein
MSVNGMCRSNVIIYQNETKFEIYCNDKAESHHITEILLKVASSVVFGGKKTHRIQPHKNDNEILSVSLIFNTNLSCRPN